MPSVEVQDDGVERLVRETLAAVAAQTHTVASGPLAPVPVARQRRRGWAVAAVLLVVLGGSFAASRTDEEAVVAGGGPAPTQPVTYEVVQDACRRHGESLGVTANVEAQKEELRQRVGIPIVEVVHRSGDAALAVAGARNNGAHFLSHCFARQVAGEWQQVSNSAGGGASAESLAAPPPVQPRSLQVASVEARGEYQYAFGIATADVVSVSVQHTDGTCEAVIEQGLFACVWRAEAPVASAALALRDSTGEVTVASVRANPAPHSDSATTVATTVPNP